jgi:mannose-6-phosphate isomerase-like protein (cupin superfamily)
MSNMPNSYLKKLPKIPTFQQTGLAGFGYDLLNSNLQVYFIDCEIGHDNQVSSDEITHLYYIIDGNGQFTLNDQILEAKSGDLIEIPPKTRFTFKGKMKLILIMEPPFNPEKIKLYKD